MGRRLPQEPSVNAHQIRRVEPMQVPDEDHRSAVLTKAVAPARMRDNLWYSPHRAAWPDVPARRRIG